MDNKVDLLRNLVQEGATLPNIGRMAALQVKGFKVLDYKYNPVKVLIVVVPCSQCKKEVEYLSDTLLKSNTTPLCLSCRRSTYVGTKGEPNLTSKVIPQKEWEELRESVKIQLSEIENLGIIYTSYEISPPKGKGGNYIVKINASCSQCGKVATKQTRSILS